MLLSMASCKRNPIERLSNPNPGGSVPQSSGIYTIYDDELKTSGGLGFIPDGGNQSIDMLNQDAPRRTINHIRYMWNGLDVGGQHLFAGFSLILTPDFSSFSSVNGKDLSAPGYTKVKFYVRGALSSGTKLRVQGPAVGNETAPTVCAPPDCLEITSLSSDWTAQEFTISASRLSNVKVFFTASIQYEQPPRTTAPSDGGSVFFDDIRYER